VVRLSNLTDLITNLAEKYHLIDKLKLDHRKVLYSKDKKNHNLKKARDQKNQFADQCEKLEHELSMLIIPDEFRSWNSLKIKKEYRKNEGSLHIFYGPRNPLCAEHGHCIIDIVNGCVTYHRPFGEKHGMHNYKNI
jgi:hypothetical protein